MDLIAHRCIFVGREERGVSEIIFLVVQGGDIVVFYALFGLVLSVCQRFARGSVDLAGVVTSATNAHSMRLSSSFLCAVCVDASLTALP